MKETKALKKLGKAASQPVRLLFNACTSAEVDLSLCLRQYSASYTSFSPINLQNALCPCCESFPLCFSPALYMLQHQTSANDSFCHESATSYFLHLPSATNHAAHCQKIMCFFARSPPPYRTILSNRLNFWRRRKDLRMRSSLDCSSSSFSARRQSLQTINHH